MMAAFLMPENERTQNWQIQAWQFKGIKDGIICDSEQMNFYYGTELLNGKVMGDGFTEHPPGKTMLTVSSVISEIKVTPRWCCL